MATLNFNGLTFSYEPIPLGLKRLMESHFGSHGTHKEQLFEEPLVIPGCTAQLAEEAAGKLVLPTVDEVMG